MTHEQANKRAPNYHAPVELRKSAFSEEEILAANNRHDREYGWSVKMPHVYTNLARCAPASTARPGKESTV